MRRALLTLSLAALALVAADQPASPIGDHAAMFKQGLPEVPAAPAGMGTIREQVMRSAPTLVIFGVASLIPAAVLMATAFVRISIVLTLLRQALGSPQIPGNQVLMALALLLTALVMRPQAEAAYERGIKPFADGTKSIERAWADGTAPVKSFMVAQIQRTGHEKALWDLYDLSEPPSPTRFEPRYGEDFPLSVVAPAFLVGELSTALWIGFQIYLPFLVVDLVVSAVLSAMGLVMLPPSLVSMPLKLILFALADGWLLVSGMLLRSFG